MANNANSADLKGSLGADLVRRDDDGVPVIVGANTKVAELVSHVQAYPAEAEEVLRQLPHLTLPQIRAGLAFYDEHREEIDQDLARRLAQVEGLRREVPEAPIVAKIRRLRDGDS